jgi:hypothetical protein
MCVYISVYPTPQPQTKNSFWKYRAKSTSSRNEKSGHPERDTFLLVVFLVVLTRSRGSENWLRQFWIDLGVYWLRKKLLNLPSSHTSLPMHWGSENKVEKKSCSQGFRTLESSITAQNSYHSAMEAKSQWGYKEMDVFIILTILSQKLTTFLYRCIFQKYSALQTGCYCAFTFQYTPPQKCPKRAGTGR